MFHGSEVKMSEGVVEIVLYNNSLTQAITVDRATAARLINQLRRTLDAAQN